MSDSHATTRRNLPPRAGVSAVIQMRGSPTVPAAPQRATSTRDNIPPGLPLEPRNESGPKNQRRKELIGREAARLCSPKEAVMIDGGSTTQQMCSHLAGLNLQVLTNSLLIVNVLMSQKGTRVLVPGGQVFE